MKIFLLILLISSFSFANVTNKQIANIFMLGFYGTYKSANSIVNDICNKGLGGVILFSKSPVQRGAIKNFATALDLKKLTQKLKSCGTKPLIAVDQEGGVVQRVKFKRYPSASKVAKIDSCQAYDIFKSMARELHNLGINFNLAPVVDLAINPRNRVIVGWGRSYGKSPKKVIKYAKLFVNAMYEQNVATALKHFPGHGSSLGDTHKGFVDVTNSWSKIELEPYYKISSDSVMIAHIFNKKLDANYPASLSKKVIKGLLRGQIGFDGVVISDDMQMGAISKHYSLKQRVKLAINAGEDIILFANQVSSKNVVKIDKLIKIVRELLNNNEISEQDIIEANRRINSLKNRLY